MSSVCDVLKILCMACLAVAGPVETISRQIATTQQGGAILFFATHQGSLRDILFDPIVFNKILVNQGLAYRNDTGVFTAPVTGIYQFVFAAQLCRGDKNNVWYFVINGRSRMSCHAQVSVGETSLNTCHFMEELQKGEQVWMRQNIGSCAWASSTSTTINFSGVLLASKGTSKVGAEYIPGNSCPLPSMRMGNRASNSAGLKANLCIVALAMPLYFLLLHYIQ